MRKVPPEGRPPVIVLSARGQEGDKVTALDAGAEDYVIKLFGANGLLAPAAARAGAPTPAAC